MNIKFSKQAVDTIIMAIDNPGMIKELILDTVGFDNDGAHLTISRYKQGGDVLIYDPHPTRVNCNTNGALLEPTVYYTLTEHNLEADFSVEYRKRLRSVIEEGLKFNRLTGKQAIGMVDILNGRNR